MLLYSLCISNSRKGFFCYFFMGVQCFHKSRKKFFGKPHNILFRNETHLTPMRTKVVAEATGTQRLSLNQGVVGRSSVSAPASAAANAAPGGRP